MTTDLTDPIFTDENAAREHFERLRWPNGPVCPHCGSVDNAAELKGKSTRPGLYKCRDCRKPFTATIGTLYERSHIPLHKWLLATHLMCASKKGISAHQLYRMLGFGSYRTAWFMAHRIREGMRELHPETEGPLGGENKVVEADETYVGGKARNRKGRVPPKEAVITLVERGGRARSHHVPEVTAKTLRPILMAQLDGRSYLMTDEGTVYPPIAKGVRWARHGQPLHRRVRPGWLLAYEHRRGLFFDLQAWNHRHLPLHQCSALEALSVRVRFQVQRAGDAEGR